MPAALYYLYNSYAPKPNCPSRFGSAVVISAEGKVLLEHRKDNCMWGIVSGDIHDNETFKECAVRRTFEETGIHVLEKQLNDLGVFDDPTRIVSFSEGNIYRMVHIAYYAELEHIIDTVRSDSSSEIKWVDPCELSDYEILVTHQDILEAYFKEKHIPHTMKHTAANQ